MAIYYSPSNDLEATVWQGKSAQNGRQMIILGLLEAIRESKSGAMLLGPAEA
jgi:hypothetical protein